MPRSLIALSLALILGLSFVASAAPQVDTSQTPDNEACAHMLPEALRTQALKDHPGYRFLRVDDYSAEDIKSEKRYHGGSECLAAASGDYFGDHHTAYAFILLSDSSAIFLAARLTSDQHWGISQLGDAWPTKYAKGSFNFYVDTIPPGNYSDIGLGDDTTEQKGWLKDVTSKTPGIAIGVIESSENVYFFKHDHWVFTNVED